MNKTKRSPVKSMAILSLGLFWMVCVSLTVSAADTPPAGETQFLSNIRQLTFEGRRSGEGYFSPDGKVLIFQSEREPGNPFYQIYLLDLESGDTHRVSPGVGKTTCAFFRPGTDEVLFASTHLDPEARTRQQAELDFRASGKERRYSWDYDEQMDIFACRRDGSQLRRLTDAPGYDAEGSYSPDGKQIVFCSLRAAYPTNKLSQEERKRLETDPAWFGDIYLMNADGSDQRRLTRTPGYDGGPFFSPDGQRIIWRRFEESGVVADIYTMKLDGSDVRRLTEFKSMSWAPYFHPSGRYVIFTSNKLGFSNFELHLVDALGEREPVRATFTDGFDGLPVFSPDGAKLCWTSGRTADGKSQLFLGHWNHEAALAALQQAAVRGRAVQVPVAEVATIVSSLDTGLPLRKEVTFLASDALEGRLTGSKGAQLAGDHIADVLRRAGLKPFGSDGGYFQNFDFNSGVRLVTNANHFTVAGADGRTASFEVEKDFRPFSFSANGAAEGEVVFAGYGLFVAGKPGEGYDSYAGLDVTNKIVLALRYVPEDVEPKRRQELNRYAGLRYKAMMARERGAKALLVVGGPNSPNAGELVKLSSDGSLAGSGIIAASISSNAASALLAGSGKDLKSLQSALDQENPHAEGGFVIPMTKVKLVTAVEHLKKTDRNVLA
ncbi:MAG TPA: peptidase M28, partial [Verrucomicrobiae bacterium]